MSSRSPGNTAAARFGYAKIGLSTPEGGWRFGHDNIINDDNPLPCSEEDSEDIPYLRALFDFIESRPERFDADRVYSVGFSQNSMFSAYLAFCFRDKVRGIWQGGSGMALAGETPYLPGCQAQVI